MTNPSFSNGQIVPFDYVKIDLQAANLAQAIEKTSADIASCAGLSARILKDRVIANARVQSPALSEGIALMHLRISGLQKPFQTLIRLKTPIDIDAPDKRHADLFCLLLTSEKDGPSALMTVSRLSRFLKDSEIQTYLRTAATEQQILSFMDQPLRRIAA